VRREPALLVLADGATFEGYAAGYLPESGLTTGEFVFNTAMSGYQEVITDPSYAGQVIAFTYPHVGNYGVTPLDDEALRPWCRGIVVRDLSPVESNWRSSGSLEEFLVRNRVPALVGIDTRRLTRHLRDYGALAGAFGHVDEASVSSAAHSALGTDGQDLVSEVSTPTRLPSRRRCITRGRRGLRHQARDGGPIGATIQRHGGALVDGRVADS
jgi:carbamoyl-phosphate synthase small subunit